MPPTRHLFYIVYELLTNEYKADSVDFIEEAKRLLGAETCKIKNTESGTKLIEFGIASEEVFCLVVQKTDYYAEKLNATMVELHTA